MGLIINDLPQHGVLIHGPESPGFRERLLSLFRFGAPPELEDVDLHYSIVVENQSPQHIHRIKLVWGPYPRESGAPFSSGAARHGNSDNMLGSLIKSGGQCPWSPIHGNHFVGLRRTEASQRMRRDHLKTRLAASDKWSVDIDYVLFGDGSFVGPDTELEFDRIEAQNKGALDMIVELNRMLDAGDDAFAYAEHCAAIPKERIDELYPDQHLYARSPEIVYLWEKKMAAKGLLARWQFNGRQGMIEEIRRSANPRFHLPEQLRPDIPEMNEEAWLRQRVWKDLVAELSQKLDEGAEVEEIFAHIVRYASMNRRQIEALYPDVRAILPNLDRNYAISRQTKAMNIIKHRERFGELASVEWIRESSKAQIPLFRR